MKKVFQSIRSNGLSWSIPVGIIVVWQLLSQFHLLSSKILPSPYQVLLAAIKLGRTGELWANVEISTERAVAGFFIGGSIGFLLGLFNGIFPLSEKLTDSTIQMVRNIPHLALIPLVILWFGVQEEAKLFLVSLGVFFPIYINTFQGIRTVSKKYLEMAEIYDLHGLSLFWNVILPGALPSILVGVRFSLGVMWISLIVAETIAADSGIGYMAMNAREFMQMDVVVLSIILYALLGKLSDLIAKFFEHRLLKWNPSYQKH